MSGYSEIAGATLHSYYDRPPFEELTMPHHIPPHLSYASYPSPSPSALHTTREMFHTLKFLLSTLLLPYTFLQHHLPCPQPTYYLPSERSPHLRTLMAWPSQNSTNNLPDLFLAQREFALIANAIAKYEPVWLYTPPSNRLIAADLVSENVEIVLLETAEMWLRDTGPIFVEIDDGKPGPRRQVGIDFNLNYWGDERSKGAQRVARKQLEAVRIERIQASSYLAGGAIDSDGQGTLLATKSSIINENRNPNKSQTEIEEELRALLGVTKIIWLPGSKDAAHVDSLARFGPDSRTVIMSRPNEAVPRDSWRWRVYKETHDVLSSATNAAGYRFTIVEIEEALTVPRAGDWSREQCPVLEGFEGGVVTNYVGFYLVNGGIVVPQFGEEKTDREAVEGLQRLSPGRVVETVRLDWMAYAGGGPYRATVGWPVPGG